MTQGCVMDLTQGHISEVKVTVHAYLKPCLGHKSSLPRWILIMYHTIVSWPRLRVILPRSRPRFTHGIFSIPLPFLCNLDVDDTLHNCCPWPRGCCSGGGICPVRTCLVNITISLGNDHSTCLIFMLLDRMIGAYYFVLYVCLLSTLNITLTF